LSRFESIQPVQLWDGRTIDASIWIKHVDNRQAMTLTDLEVQYVVRGRNF
jgi:hypothetical protein